MESEAIACDLPTTSLTPTSPFAQSTGQKERPNLSLNLKSIDLRGECQKSTPGPTTASILKKIETVAPDLKEIFPHINDSHPHASGTDQLDTHLTSLESTSVSNVSIDNLFDECFKTASSRRLHLNVSPSLASKDQSSLETPAIKLVSPSKGPNLLNPKTLACEASSINNANNCGDIHEEKANNNNNNTLPSRKRGRPPKAVTKASTHDNDSCDNDSESKKLRDRERNRQAAINYRRNQKDWVREISTRVRLLEDKNATLEAQLATAQREIQHLQQLVKSNNQSTKLIYKCLVPSVIVSGPSDEASASQ